MKFKPKYIPLIALGAGIVTFFLRFWLIATGIDHRGLFLPDHPANALSFVVLALGLGLMYLCLRPMTGKPSYEKMFPKSPIALLGSVVGGVSILYTTLLDFTQMQDTSALLCSVFGVLSALGILLAGVLRYRGKRPHVLCHSFVSIYMMVHLVCQYRQWSAEPQLQEYFFQMLSSVFLMITAYHRATLDSLIGNRRWFVFFNYGCVLLCLSALQGENWVFYAGLGIWCATCNCSVTPEKEMELPKNVQLCLSKLENAGFEAYVVGGCVRDSLLGLVPQDYDMCTGATPKEIARIFHKYDLVRNGEKHGTIGVVIDGEVFEITTFRTEGAYSDSRHPDSVDFVKNLQEDLSRRDFTVNAMAYSPHTGYVDLFGGKEDLKNRVLRTVGEPQKRFTEDALRILRGVRFAVRFGLTPEEHTLQAMNDLAPTMDNLAKERVFSELCKLLLQINAQQLLQFASVITAVMPAVKDTLGFDQHSPHHAYDVYTHTAYVVEALPADLTLRWAGLLHDIGKPQVFTQDEEGRGHFYGHAEAGAQSAETVLSLLRSPTELRERVSFLVENHMHPLPADKKLLRRYLSKWGEEALRQLVTLQKADFTGKGVIAESEVDFDYVSILIDQLVEENHCLSIQNLAVSGNDILALGIEAGPQIGKCLQHLLDLVLEDSIPNEKDALLQTAKQYFEENQEA